jgi:prevent-host-death family protein
MDWKLADAKTKLSEVVRRALTEGPQRVLRRNDTVVVLAEEEYERLVGSRLGFKDFLLDGPDMDKLELERDKAPMRDITL